MSTWVLSLTDETESPALFFAIPPAAPTTLPVASFPAVATVPAVSFAPSVNLQVLAAIGLG
jgi:hypothetical protein